MKKLLPVILLILAFFKFDASMAQTLLWSRFDSSDVVFVQNNYSTYFSDYVYGYKTSSNGDIIGIHSIKGNVRFGNTTYNVPTDFALVKVIYDKDMNIKSSSKLTLPLISVYGFDIDENNNLYLYGIFKGTKYFTPIDSIKSMHSTESNTFIVKFSSNNLFKWARTINNDQSYISPTKVSICKGNIYLLGYLTSGRMYYNRTLLFNWNYSYNLDYFISIDTSGVFNYANRIRVSNQTLPVTIQNFDIDTLLEKAYFIGGCREGGLVFTDRDTSNLTNGISYDNRLIFSFDLKSGIFYKSKIIFTGGSGTHSYDVKQNANSIYIMSNFLGNINLLDTNLNTTKSEFFILKLDTIFKTQWIKVTSNNNSGSNTDMTFDRYDNGVIITRMYDSLIFKDFTISRPFKNLYPDNYVLCFNKNNGKIKWGLASGCDSLERDNKLLSIDNKVLIRTIFDGVNIIKFNGISYTSNKPQAASFLISNDQLLNLPGKLSATAMSESSIKLNWYDSTAGEEWYVIERSPNGISNWLIIDSVAGNIVTYTNTGLNTFTTYYYRIRAKCIYNTSAPGNSAQATTLAASTIPNAPSNLVAATINKNLVLTWNDNSNNETGFKIYRSTTSAGTFILIDSILANVTTYTNLNLASGNYCYKVKAYNSVGLSGYSNESCHNFVGIENDILPNNFLIYPQPLKESLTISNAQELIIKITILSMDGKVVLEKDQIKLHEINIPTGAMASGNYILNITTLDGKIYSTNLVKE